MTKIRLDSVLLLALVLPLLMTYRISSGQTPYWLFGLIFIGLLGYIAIDLLEIKESSYRMIKTVLLWTLIVITLGSAFLSSIIVRHIVAPTYMIHDIILQQEAAIRFLHQGKNPYLVTYFGTPLEQWHYSDTEVNPALYHFVMQPFYLEFAVPFSLFSNRTIGYFDGRMPLFFLYLVALFAAWKLNKNHEHRSLFVILLAFNPAMLPYNLEGRSDMFVFSFLLAGIALLSYKRFTWAGVVIGLAFAIKQSVWPLLPFYLAYLYFHQKSGRKFLYALIPFLLTFSAVVLPFFLWNPKAFLDSTVFYLSGSGTHSYPISGYGFGMVLRDLGVILDVHQYFPFIIIQMVVGFPLLVILFLYLGRNPTVKRLMIAYGIFLFVYWYFSRYFNNSHLAYISDIFIAAYFIPETSK